MKKVLIFGIGGFVGRYLALEFLSEGYVVFGSDIKKSENILKEIYFYEADLLNADAVFTLVVKVEPDIIVNLAAVSSVSASWSIPQKTISVNVIGALNIMEAVRKSGRTSKIMFIGSSEEYAGDGKPIDEKTPLNANNPYGISKMTQESFAKVYQESYGMQIYCVRPFNHTGIGQNDSFVLPSFCKQVAEIEKSGMSGVIKVGNLTAERDFSNVKDIVSAYRMIVESDDNKEIYNVGSGKAYKICELLDYVISLSKQEITIEVDPERFRPVDTLLICCNNNKIKSTLGWNPRYDIFDTLKEMFEYYYRN